MQTLAQIRRMLRAARLSPRKRLGQCFLVDGNLLNKLLDLAELTGRETVLEVGPGTGSLTEELLSRCRRVVVVEVDRGMCALLRRRLGEHEGLTLISGDALAGKHAVSPVVLDALDWPACLVANLPYNIATPLVAECLLGSWRAVARGEPGDAPPGLFDRLTFTVQGETANRLSARPGGPAYGPVSVIVSLLGRVRLGSGVPASAFWPRPKVTSRIVRIDFEPRAAAALADAATLSAVLSLAFGQRRKQIGSVAGRRGSAFPPERFAAAIESAGIARSARAQDVPPEGFLALANVLAGAPPAD